MPAIIILVLIIIAVAVADGFKNGILRRLLETVGLILVFLFASRLADWVEPFMTEGMGASPKVAFFGSWIIVIVGGVFLVRITAAAVSSLVTVSVVGTLDHFGGALVGLFFGCLIASLVLIALMGLPVDKHLKKEVRDNPFTEPLLHLAPSIYDAVAPLWDGEDFFQMIEDRIEPLAGEAHESIRAFLGESERDDAEEN